MGGYHCLEEEEEERRGNEASEGKQAFKKAQINTCEEAFCLQAGGLIQTHH